MSSAPLAPNVQVNVNRSLAQLSAGDNDEKTLRQRHPSARYRAPHPVFDLSCSLLSSALINGATSLQFIPAPDCAEVQMEVHGTWKDLATLPKELGEPLIARFKDATGVDVTKTGQPQTGNLPVHWQNQDFEMPVTFNPTNNGEQLLIRFVRK